jgi:hypothetical protein
MSGSLTLVDLLTQLAGAKLAFKREHDLIAVALLVLPTGRQLLLAEQTYREGAKVLLDPTSDEVETARTGSLRQIWSSERSLYLYSATGPQGGLFDEEERYEEPAAGE